MLHDPVDAIFQGMASSLLKVPLVFVPMLAALACMVLPNSEMGVAALLWFPLIVPGVFLTWATKGLVFFIALAACIAYCTAAWRFMETQHPKEIFLLLFVVAFVFFLPLSWEPDPAMWKPYAWGAALCAVYLFLSYGLPLLLEQLWKKG